MLLKDSSLRAETIKYKCLRIIPVSQYNYISLALQPSLATYIFLLRVYKDQGHLDRFWRQSALQQIPQLTLRTRDLCLSRRQPWMLHHDIDSCSPAVPRSLTAGKRLNL